MTLKAISFLRQASDSGYLRARELLATVMLNGAEGVEKDEVHGVALLLDAANHGHAPSQCRIGLMYAYGAFGNSKDIKKAIEYSIFKKLSIRKIPQRCIISAGSISRVTTKLRMSRKGFNSWNRQPIEELPRRSFGLEKFISMGQLPNKIFISQSNGSNWLLTLAIKGHCVIWG